MYITPHSYKCIKCGFEANQSPDDGWPAPRMLDFVACPKCWEKWLEENIGQMLMTVDFSRDQSGSEYEKKKP